MEMMEEVVDVSGEIRTIFLLGGVFFPSFFLMPRMNLQKTDMPRSHFSKSDSPDDLSRRQAVFFVLSFGETQNYFLLKTQVRILVLTYRRCCCKCFKSSNENKNITR